MSLSLQKSSAASHILPLSKKKKVSVFIAGTGAIGSTLLQLIAELEHPLYHLNILGVCNSKITQWHPDLDELLENGKPVHGETTNWNTIPEELIKQNNGNLVFVDATGSEVAAHQYQHLLTHGVHIATPSKRANTFGQEYFNHLIKADQTGKAQYRYETAVGAGLPIISTIKGLIHAGDEITEITGVASGTMTYVFSQLQNGIPFSKVVRTAKSEGYSEPDPRDDLSGEDVARKFLILARTSGFKFEREHIEVDSLVPQELHTLSVEDFLEKLSEYDDHWKNQNSRALVNNRKLRYIGKFSPKGIKVGVEEVKADSPLGNLQGTDNLLQIYTKRYANSPIVVQGPGAGKDVTAAGVLTDIIDIAHQI